MHFAVDTDTDAHSDSVVLHTVRLDRVIHVLETVKKPSTKSREKLLNVVVAWR